MLDVHVLTSSNRHLYKRELEEYHRARHRIFVEELKWRALESRADGREYDQFDGNGAVYLLAVDDDDGIVGGVRLLPTTAPHLLSEIFPHLASVRGIPRGADIAESTRFFVIAERRGRNGNSKVGNMLIASIIDYGLLESLSAILLVLNPFWLRKFARYAWTVQRLGRPHLHEGERLIAAEISVTPQALSGVRRACNLPEQSALTWRGELTPFIPADQAGRRPVEYG